MTKVLNEKREDLNEGSIPKLGYIDHLKFSDTGAIYIHSKYASRDSIRTYLMRRDIVSVFIYDHEITLLLSNGTVLNFISDKENYHECFRTLIS